MKGPILPDTRTSAVIQLVFGGVANAGVHALSLRRDTMFVGVIVMAATALAASGAAKLFHSERVHLGQMCPLMRRYAIGGVVLGVGHLAAMGFFGAAAPLDAFVVFLLAGLFCFGSARRPPATADPGEASTDEGHL